MVNTRVLTKWEKRTKDQHMNNTNQHFCSKHKLYYYYFLSHVWKLTHFQKHNCQNPINQTLSNTIDYPSRLSQQQKIAQNIIFYKLSFPFLLTFQFWLSKQKTPYVPSSLSVCTPHTRNNRRKHKLWHTKRSIKTYTKKK